MQKFEVGPLPHTLYKINPKWIKDLNLRAKLFEENISAHLHDLGFGNGFLKITPKVQATKENR